jgi:hypothetical protein
VRTALGEDLYWNLFGLLSLGPDWPAWQDEGQRLALEAFARIGRPQWALQARIARMNFGSTALPFRFDLVAEAPLSETAGLVPNYIDWIAKATVPALRSEALPDGKVPTALLYRLLRHAALLEYHDVAFELLLKFAAASVLERREDELVGIEAKARPTRMARLEQPLAPVSGEAPLHAYLHAPQNRAMLETLVPGNGVLALRAWRRCPRLSWIASSPRHSMWPRTDSTHGSPASQANAFDRCASNVQRASTWPRTDGWRIFARNRPARSWSSSSVTAAQPSGRWTTGATCMRPR